MTKSNNNDNGKMEFEGIIKAAKGSGNFLVSLESGPEILCTLSGKIRNNNIRVVEGDLVKIEVSPYDLSRGRIVYRHKVKRT